jgi:hypothetical protein
MKTAATTRTRRCCLAACAVLAAQGAARAADEAPQAAAAVDPARREVVLAFGYGSMVAPRGVLVYRGPESAERVAAFDGFSVDVTRRLPLFEYGARLWKMGDSSDGKGGSAHLLTRWTTEARFYPWHLRTMEPWVGAELGLALADDFALWNQADKEPAHRAVAGVRPGLVAGLEAGGRLHLASLIAVGLRGGLLFLGFDRAGGPVAESPQTAKYSVQPTDYGRRLWLSVALTAELTVPDGT